MPDHKRRLAGQAIKAPSVELSGLSSLRTLFAYIAGWAFYSHIEVAGSASRGWAGQARNIEAELLGDA